MRYLQPWMAHFNSLQEYYAQTRLLLEWGAVISKCAELALDYGNTKLATLLKLEFGGRRREIFSESSRSYWPRYLRGRKASAQQKQIQSYIRSIERGIGLVGPQNLKRRDRTPNGCGYYVAYKHGRTTRREFASKEECQAFM